MKIVLTTQIMENYGAHSWDGEGRCPQYWKAKGGEVYVFENVSIEQARTMTFWQAAEAQVSDSSDYYTETVISAELLDDCDSLDSCVFEWEEPKFVEVQCA